MAQVIERGKGRFLVRVFLGRDATTGKRRYLNKTIRGTKKQATVYATRIQHEVDTGVFREAARDTVGEFLQEWLDGADPDADDSDADSDSNRVRPKTLEGYRDSVRLHVTPVLGEVPLGELTPALVQKMVNRMKRKGRAPQTIRNALGVLRNALNAKVRDGTIPQNPARAELLDLPRQTRRELTVLTAEQARAFLEAARGHGAAGALYTVLLAGGMRPGEAQGLGWEDFDGRNVRIRRSLAWARNDRDFTLGPPKTKRSRRTVPLPDFALEAIQEQRRRQAQERLRAGEGWNDNGLIFTDATGGPLRWATLSRREFKWILQEADLPTMRPYDLRHTCASLLLASGVNPKIVSERLGHSTVSLTLDTYSAVLPGLQEKATQQLGELLG